MIKRWIVLSTGLFTVFSTTIKYVSRTLINDIDYWLVKFSSNVFSLTSLSRRWKLSRGFSFYSENYQLTYRFSLSSLIFLLCRRNPFSFSDFNYAQSPFLSKIFSSLARSKCSSANNVHSAPSWNLVEIKRSFRLNMCVRYSTNWNKSSTR